MPPTAFCRPRRTLSRLALHQKTAEEGRFGNRFSASFTLMINLILFVHQIPVVRTIRGNTTWLSYRFRECRVVNDPPWGHYVPTALRADNTFPIPGRLA